MKKLMTLFLLGGLLMLSSCEAPQGPEALQGSWMILSAKKLVVITESEIMSLTFSYAMYFKMYVS